MFNVLSIGYDSNVLSKDSESFARQKIYSSWLKILTVFVLTTKNSKTLNQENLSIVPIKSALKIGWIPTALQEAKKKHSHEKFDLVTTQDPFICGLIGVLIKVFLKIPLNIQIHTEAFNTSYFRNESPLNFCFYYLGLFTLRFADSVRGRDKRIINDIKRRYPRLKDKVFYVGAPIEEIFLTKIKRKKPHNPLILSAGRPVPQKNFPLLKQAFMGILKKYPTAQLEIAGSNPWGWKSAGELKTLMDQASVFVLPSNHEGWALVCLQALARGTPVVMTNTGCAEEIVINKKTGIVVPVGDKLALEEGIIKVLSNPNKYQQMAKKGRELVKKDTNLKKIREDLIKMYKQTIIS